jgi:hypothetical protein
MTKKTTIEIPYVMEIKMAVSNEEVECQES